MQSVTPVCRDYKVLVVGTGGVEKADLAATFMVGDRVDEHLEEDGWRRCIIDGQPARLDVLEPAGQEEYAAVREQYLRAADGLIMVYSITSRDSFDEISTYHQRILEVKGQKSFFPAVVVANKCHLIHERQVGEHEGRNLAKNLGCAFIETSSEQGINVDEAFYMLVREIRKYSNNADNMESGDVAVTPSPHPWSLKSLVRVTKSVLTCW